MKNNLINTIKQRNIEKFKLLIEKEENIDS
jgi:hypothetical protein